MAERSQLKRLVRDRPSTAGNWATRDERWIIIRTPLAGRPWIVRPHWRSERRGEDMMTLARHRLLRVQFDTRRDALAALTVFLRDLHQLSEASPGDAGHTEPR